MSTCLGRVGTMIDMVRADCNEAQGKMVTDTMIIAWFNRGLDRLARQGLLRKETELETEVGTEAYPMIEVAPDWVDVKALRDPDVDYFSSGLQYPYKAATFTEYQQTKYQYQVFSDQGVVVFCVDNGILYLHPTPTTVKTWNVLHTYKPTKLECVENEEELSEDDDTNINPNFPAAFDDFLVFTALEHFHARRFPNAGSTEERAYWAQKAEQVFAELCYQAAPRGLTIRSA